MMCRHQRWYFITALFMSSAVAAGDGLPVIHEPSPQVALIIDDLGDRLHDGLRTVALDAPITCAILPQTTYSKRLATAAHAAGKEVMLHQPMQAEEGRRLGPGGIDLTMGQEQVRQILQANLNSVPYAQGMNNHMGSLLTRFPDRMRWLMTAMSEHGGLYFVDSTTTRESVAMRVAAEQQLPNARRNVFLDHARDEASITRQFVRLVQYARKHGTAIGIAHPHEETLAVLERILPHIEEYGVRLVPVSVLISQVSETKEPLWQASLSPSHPVAKNLKQ